jgi:hypothetical protein
MHFDADAPVATRVQRSVFFAVHLGQLTVLIPTLVSQILGVVSSSRIYYPKK